MKKAIIDCSPYRESFLFICCTKAEATKFLKTTSYANIADRTWHDGCTITSDSDHAILWIDSGLSKDGRIASTVHELVHIMSYIWRTRGIDYDPNNDESYCYLIQNLLGQILKKKMI